jgi:hypothetical protein
MQRLSPAFPPPTHTPPSRFGSLSNGRGDRPKVVRQSRPWARACPRPRSSVPRSERDSGQRPIVSVGGDRWRGQAPPCGAPAGTGQAGGTNGIGGVVSPSGRTRRPAALAASSQSPRRRPQGCTPELGIWNLGDHAPPAVREDSWEPSSTMSVIRRSEKLVHREREARQDR